MHRVEMIKQRSIELAESTNLAIVPTDSATATNTTGGRPAKQSPQLHGLAARPPKPVRQTVVGSSDVLPGPSSPVLLPAAAMQLQRIDPGEMLRKALSKAKIFRDVIGSNEGPQGQRGATSKVVAEQKVKLSLAAMKSAREGLQAVADLKVQGRLQSKAAVEHEHALLTLLGTSAAVGYAARDELLEDKWMQQFDIIQPIEPAIGATIVQAELHNSDVERQQTEEWQGYLSEIEQYRGAMDELLRRMKAPDTHKKIRENVSAMVPLIRTNLGFCHETMQSIRSLLVDIHRLQLERQVEAKGMPEVMARLHELDEAKNYRGDDVAAAFSALSQVVIESICPSEAGVALTPQVVAQHKDVLEDYAEHFGRIGLKLCVDVAALIENDCDDHIWRSMLDLAQALTDYRQCVLDLTSSVVAGKREVVTSPSATIEQLPVPRASPRPARKHRKPVNRAAEESSLVPAPPAILSDKRTLAQKQADALLKSIPLERSMVNELDADFMLIAKMLGRDTSSVGSMMHRSGQDAAIAFTFVRASVRDWFARDRLLQTKAKLSPEDDRVAQLTERLQLVDMIEQRVRIREADALKSDPQPRSPHLSRLLKMSEVARVTSPIRLPSDHDNGDRGTLFEIRIDHAPLSNGKRPAPWFVHLHTAEPVTADALPTLGYKAFNAVHLKTAREKNLGKRWEMLMRALGHADAKVHRSTIDSALLASLLHMRSGVKPHSDSSQTSSGACISLP
ncbi:type III secretion system effector XopP [Xanthomonas campestris]|uniref:type III secretion system effector XopP n=1 Tax=Xanthomonas campestris TaxID=339 RepID=UPI002B22323D|nr:type III secretion system effector XopP [Xanthomonas campestris]MEA9482771.1 type III secretion system effector XopP [Xanthomonas campestris]